MEKNQIRYYSYYAPRKGNYTQTPLIWVAWDRALPISLVCPYLRSCIYNVMYELYNNITVASALLRFKVTGYREMGVVWNKTYLPFSFSANAQKLLTTLGTIVFKRFYRFLVAQETP